MNSKILFRRPDPHHVYDWLLDGRLVSVFLKRVCRGFLGYSSDFRLIRVILIVLGDLTSAVRLCRYSGHKVFVSEFSTVTALLTIYPLSFICDLREVHLNLNHNLLNSREPKILSILAQRIKVCFIEASPLLMEQYPFVTNLHIMPRAKCVAAVKDVYVFSGNRHEQFLMDVNVYATEIDRAASREHLDVHIVGALSGRRLGFAEYYDAFNENAVVVLLYSFENYEVRHSGIALHAIAAGCRLLAPRSALTDHYADRSFSVRTFDGLDEFKRELESILICPKI